MYFNVRTAPTFENFSTTGYHWGVLVDVQLYKNLYLSVGTEHKKIRYGVRQTYVATDPTFERFGTRSVTIETEAGFGYFSFPLRFAYRQPIYKGIYISPNLGFSYMYNTPLNRQSADLSYYAFARDTNTFYFKMKETDFRVMNKHLFHVQAGLEIGYTRNFFSVYAGVNYSLGLNKMFEYSYVSEEKDLISNTPIQRYRADLFTTGTNLNGYLGFRFQLYPIIKIKKKEK